MELPPELVQHVLSYCGRPDILNLACCSRHQYHLVRHHLWKQVFLNFPECGAFEQKKEDFHNLKHAEFLGIYWTPQELQGSGNVVLCGEKLFSFAFNYSKFLQSFNLDKLTTLTVTGVDIESFVQQTVGTFTNLHTLSLRSVKLSDWSCVMNLCRLKVLALSQCNVTEGALEKLSQVYKLEELTLHECVGITQQGLATINTMLSLKKLQMIDLLKPITPLSPTLDVEALCALTNLECLLLDNVPAKTNPRMNMLWASLSKLKRLELREFTLEDDDLKELHLLTALTTLKLRHPPDGTLTSECFNYIKAVTSLRCVSFSTEVCTAAGEHPKVVEQNLMCLNEMDNLRSIIIEKSRNDNDPIDPFLAVLCSEFKWGIKMPSNFSFQFQKFREYTLFRCKRV